MSETKEKDYVHFVGFWTKESKNGDKYLKGSLNEYALKAFSEACEKGYKDVLLFKNNYKDSDNKPDWVCRIAKGKEKSPSPEKAKDKFDDSDIPF